MAAPSGQVLSKSTRMYFCEAEYSAYPVVQSPSTYRPCSFSSLKSSTTIFSGFDSLLPQHVAIVLGTPCNYLRHHMYLLVLQAPRPANAAE